MQDSLCGCHTLCVCSTLCDNQNASSVPRILGRMRDTGCETVGVDGWYCVYAKDYVKIKIHGMRDTVGMRDTMSMWKYIGCDTVCGWESLCVCYVNIRIYRMWDTLYGWKTLCVWDTLCTRDTMSISKYLGCETLYMNEKYCVYARQCVNTRIHRMWDT